MEGACAEAGAAREWTEAHAEELLFLAAFSFVAGLIHVEASAIHLGPHPLYGVFFALLAAFQFAWGVWAYGRGTAGTLHLGIAVSLAVVAIWAVSRAVGVPFGPEAWQPESVGALDVAATVDEFAIVGLSVWTLRPEARGFAQRDGLRLVVMALLTVTVLAAMIGGGGHAH
jgi:hypothetical protein